MRRIRIERLSFAFVVILTSVRVSAEPVEARAEARGHFDRGVGFSRQQAYAEALTEFERAYQIFPHFSVLYNIGQALIALGRPTEAVAALTRYLEEGGTNIESSRRQEVEATIKSELSKTSSIEVRVDVAGALISIDDKPYGRSPLAAAVRVDTGVHRVLATLDSGERRETQIDAKVGQVAQPQLEFGVQTSGAPARGQVRIRCPENALTVLVDDQPLGVTPIAGSLWLEAGTHRLRFARGSERSAEQLLSISAQSELELDCSVPVSLAAPPAAREPPAPDTSHSTQRTLAYVVGAAGIALSGAAAAHFFWNRARHEEWQSRYDTYYDDPTEQNRQSANDLANSVSNASVVTVGLAVGAGVALGTSAVLFLTSSGSVAPAGNTGAGGPFLTLRGTF